MPKPEVLTHHLRLVGGEFVNLGPRTVVDDPPAARINPDGTWVFVDDQDREILHWDLKLKAGDRLRSPLAISSRIYEVAEVDRLRQEPYRLEGSASGIEWFDIGIERWTKIEPAPAWRFVPGDLVHSARAGGTFRVKEIVEAGRVCRMEDSEGRVTPFDLDYVQSHFKRFGEPQ